MTSLADQLIDAQVAYVLAQLSEDRLLADLGPLVDDALAVAGGLTLEQVVDPATIKPVVRRLLQSVPASVGASEVVDAATDVLYDGPSEPFAIGELVVREQIEAIVDEILGLAPLAERALDRLTASPLVGTVASRFMGRIVGEVLAANKAVADKVPGLGSLMAFGTGAASKVMGAADKQFEGLLGDTAGKSATFAVKRLNKILVETLKDPTTREAVLQVWDLVAAEPVTGLEGQVAREDVTRLVGAVQGVVATAAATDHVADLADAFVDAFFVRYGTHPVTAVLDDLEITRDDLVTDLGAIVPRVVGSVVETGKLEELVRARIEPFFRSAEVSRLLAD
jgi:hypothetical protein